MSSGDFGDVGVGGLATAGGIGFLARKFGLTIDHVTGAEVVLADGRIVRADASENPDLLWALRGAGGNFGIVTAFELDAYPVGDVVLAQMLYDASDTAALLERWGKLVEAAPRELTSFLYLFAGRRGSPPAAQAITVWADDDTDAAVGGADAAAVGRARAGPAGTGPSVRRDRGAARRHALRRARPTRCSATASPCTWRRS